MVVFKGRSLAAAGWPRSARAGQPGSRAPFQTPFSRKSGAGKPGNSLPGAEKAPLILSHRDFRWLWLGQLLSKLGSQFNYIALAWMMLSSTGSSLATGGVYLAQILPAALLGWGAGVVVDRSDRRRLMILLDGGRALLVASLLGAWWLGRLHPALIYTVTFLVSSLSLIFFAAEKSIIPHLVTPQELTEANAYAEMTEQIGAMLGPALAGMLIALLPSPIWLLAFDALSFGLSALTLMALNWRDLARPGPGGNPLAEIKEGLHYLLREPFLRRVLVTVTAVNFLVAPFSVVFPILAERTLRAGPQGFGALMGAIGAGMLLGSLLVGPLSRRLSPAQLIYGGIALAGLGFGLMGATTHLGMAAGLAGLAGFGVAPANAVILTRVQQRTPQALQGRVFASMFALVTLAVPLGTMLVAPLIDWLGPQQVLMGMGTGTLATAALSWLSGGGRDLPTAESQVPDDSGIP